MKYLYVFLMFLALLIFWVMDAYRPLTRFYIQRKGESAIAIVEQKHIEHWPSGGSSTQDYYLNVRFQLPNNTLQHESLPISFSGYDQAATGELVAIHYVPTHPSWAMLDKDYGEAHHCFQFFLCFMVAIPILCFFWSKFGLPI